MGLFKKIKKAFKKVVKGVKKAVKGVVKGVKKVAKKIGSSKILKALAMAAAVIVTGGAAIGAIGGTAATSTFGSWMVGASSAITSVPVVGTLFKPFAAAGKLGGNIIGGTTDLLGITDKATRMGYKLDASGKYVVDTTKTFSTGKGQKFFKPFETKGQTLAGAKAGNYGTIGVGKVVDPTGAVGKGTLSSGTGTLAATSGSTTGNLFKQAAISQGFSLAGSAVANEYFSEDPRGTSDSLFLETKSPLSPIQIYAAENNIDFGDIYANPTYGTGDPYYMMNAALYNQDTIGAPVSIDRSVV